MNLRNFGTKLRKNYAWELQFFYRHCDWESGFTPINLDVQFDWYCSDHKPSFEFRLVLFNFTIFDFNIYNIWHCDSPNSPMYEKHLKEEEDSHHQEMDDMMNLKHE